MSFKNLIQADLNIFINTDEFAEMHNIDGEEMLVVIDSETLEVKKSKNDLYEGDILFYVKKSVFGYAPALGQIVRFDGDVYMVSDFQDDNGLYAVTLSGNKS